ncbi:hypothetical protein FNF29_00459 [Cafeteria roenbergensis]|uniref:Uncharacterized protein n=1 Tax=Cafeteria roenbergensis TaxID=33653 RepID=A0A5A8CXE7_CAFRO|nr:hypothetical protein FNF29_00459 [Cafeteria roenbergensis]|eukprot:KAA0157107.1 hypothetical protein FNF29_00459 [Cafeteria roenbergensis]
MADILTRICKQRELDVAEARAAASDEAVLAAARAAAPCLNLADRIAAVPCEELVVAAEFKRASPSKGDIACDLEIGAQVREYAEGGASVISVLTEPTWFKGSLEDLAAAREAADLFAAETGKPRPLVLRKDFVVDRYQVLEARARGADTVLLIVAWLETADRVRALLEVARSLGMEPFVEVASLAELRVALEAGSRVIGVNNRDLRTFKVDPDMTGRVVGELQRLSGGAAAAEATDAEDRLRGAAAAAVVFAFSGIKGPSHVRELRQSCGEVSPLRGVLVGEHLMRAGDARAEVAALRGAWPHKAAASVASAAELLASSEPGARSKICGVCTADDAVAAARAGASFVGMILCPGTPRSVGAEEAAAITASLRAFRETESSSLLGQARDRKAHMAARSFALVRAAARARPLAVGVFRGQGPSEVASLAAAAGVDVAQLHGSEDPSDAGWAELAVPIVKVIHVEVSPATEAAQAAAATRAAAAAPEAEAEAAVTSALAQARAWAPVASALILDTKIKGAAHGGGSGVSFDWRLARLLTEASGGELPVGIAGGLTPSNVRAAAEASGAFLVDVSGGVEASLRRKDGALVAEFCVEAGRARLQPE